MDILVAGSLSAYSNDYIIYSLIYSSWFRVYWVFEEYTSRVVDKLTLAILAVL